MYTDQSFPLLIFKALINSKMERKYQKPALLVIKALEEEEGEQKEAEYPTIYYGFYKL